MKLSSTAPSRHVASLSQALRRYHWIVILLALATTGASAFAQEGTSAVPYFVSKVSSNWRYCSKCHALFHIGTQEGVCPAGGKHMAQGYNFQLPFDLKGTPKAQTKWRECKLCHEMFYDGFSQKGLCPSAPVVHNGVKGFDPHEADRSTQYVLTHDVPGTSTLQTGWRYCGKCSAMFYDGYPDKGHCPAGGGHAAAGYNFALQHDPAR